MAMSFVNYSMLTKKIVRHYQKTLFWERYQLIALFRVFSWFDGIRMGLHDEEMAGRLWGPVTKNLELIRVLFLPWQRGRHGRSR